MTLFEKDQPPFSFPGRDGTEWHFQVSGINHGPYRRQPEAQAEYDRRLRAREEARRMREGPAAR